MSIDAAPPEDGGTAPTGLSPAPEPLEGYDQLPHADTTVSTPDQLTGMLPAVDPDASAAQFRRETRARGLSGESER